MFLVILQEEEYFSNSRDVCCFRIFLNFFFQHHPGGWLHTTLCSYLSILGTHSCFHTRCILAGMNGDLFPSAILLSPRRRRCSGWPGFFPTIPRPSKKSDPIPICAPPRRQHCCCQEELGDGAQHLAPFCGLKPPTNG